MNYNIATQLPSPNRGYDAGGIETSVTDYVDHVIMIYWTLDELYEYKT